MKFEITENAGVRVEITIQSVFRHTATKTNMALFVCQDQIFELCSQLLPTTPILCLHETPTFHLESPSSEKYNAYWVGSQNNN